MGDQLGKYSVIYADPPWEYRQNGSVSNIRGMANQHYPTMSTSALAALPVGDLATGDAMLFMWATFPNIDQALQVMKAWGFQYKTAAFVWVKTNKKNHATFFWGMGAYTRANAEVCLLGVRPGTRARAVVKRRDVHQIVSAPVDRHSQKPQIVRDRIVQLVGDVPRIELFARTASPGWAVWGNEVESDIDLV